ncbi:hypothetical protein [Bacteroides pyogenes]|uniref:hypothetical protein n=1 Tax=Bacteroides pyogenes TaxID=310300 RepID=UPI0011E3ECB0|nr:hypothetical protein [Bacteroides pyogenes]TYK39984.1 hypothetical protein FNJ61_01585 [Bacteroides pyogenes]
MGNFYGNSGKLLWQQSGNSVQAKGRLCSSQREATFKPKRGYVQAKEKLCSSQREAPFKPKRGSVQAKEKLCSGKAEAPPHKRLYGSNRNGHGKPPPISPLYW